MKKLFFVILVSLLIIPTYVYAEECSDSELVRIRKLANAIKFEIRHIGKQFEGEYGIHINGMVDDFYVSTKKKVYNNNDIIEGLKPKESYRLSVYLRYEHVCYSRFSYQRTIKMPAYNRYYNSDICEGNEEIPYCKMTFDSSNYTKEKFDVLVNNYLESKIEKVDRQEDNKFIVYLIICIPVIIIIAIVALIVKKRKKVL